MALRSLPVPIAPKLMVSETFCYGYYIAAQNLLAGDPSLASEAEAYYYETLGLDPRFARPYDGVSICHINGVLTVRVVLQNFFTDRFDVRVHDYPRIIYTVCLECGNKRVRLRPPDNDFLTILLRGYLMSVAIPTHIMVQKCDCCGEVYLGQSEYDRISGQMIKELS